MRVMKVKRITEIRDGDKTYYSHVDEQDMPLDEIQRLFMFESLRRMGENCFRKNAAPQKLGLL